MLEKLMIFVEEISMEAALEQLMPKLLQDAEFEIFRFQCKDDLLKNLPARLRAYSSWLPPEWAILVLVDRDNSDCRELKQQLEAVAQQSGLSTKTQGGDRFQVVNRIVIEELEAWFFGDWPAVKQAYPRVPDNIPQKSAFRDPDAIKGGTWEALERVLKRAGYFPAGLNKLQCAREVATHMTPDANRSASFQAFVQAINAARAWE
jgi:hypothetical protein